MSLKWIVLTTTGLAVCATADPVPLAAQPLNCSDLYRQIVALYQTAPLSAEYAQARATYSASCAGSAPAASAAPIVIPPAKLDAPAPGNGYAPGTPYQPQVGVGTEYGASGVSGIHH